MARFETKPARVTYVGPCGSRRDLAVDDPDTQSDQRILDCTACEQLHQFHKTEDI
jgi:hypothetical protein